jgi:DNA-binding CsgD family transcriptional regulator
MGGSARVPYGCPLSPRQFEVLTVLCDGLSYHEAAARLGIGFSSIRTHAAYARRKLGVRSTAEAVAMMGRSGWWGWVPPEPPPPPREPEPSDFVKTHPWAAAILAEFDQWNASRWSDQCARDGLHIAAQGACHTADVTPSDTGPSYHHEPMRRLLHELAADTIQPSVHVRKEAA